jgi:hypothetical protein
MISDSLAGISDVQEFMERTSHVLSLISRNVGVTVATSGRRTRWSMCTSRASAIRRSWRYW